MIRKLPSQGAVAINGLCNDTAYSDIDYGSEHKLHRIKHKFLMIFVFLKQKTKNLSSVYDNLRNVGPTLIKNWTHHFVVQLGTVL